MNWVNPGNFEYFSNHRGTPFLLRDALHHHPLPNTFSLHTKKTHSTHSTPHNPSTIFPPNPPKYPSLSLFCGEFDADPSYPCIFFSLLRDAVYPQCLSHTRKTCDRFHSQFFTSPHRGHLGFFHQNTTKPSNN